MIISKLHIDSFYCDTLEEAYSYAISFVLNTYGYSVHVASDGVLAIDTNALEIKLKDSFNIPTSGFAFDGSKSDFDTDLYEDLIDNTETESMLKTYVNDGDISGYTDKDIEIMRLIEKYNKNVLALRATRKVEIENTINTSSDSSSAVDLTTVNQQLTNMNTNLDNISSKLETTEIIDNSKKSITDVINQQSNTIQVDELGILRNKKGYY